MTLTIHHLQISQSERVVWLCEELGLEYDLKLHQRAPVFSPQSILDLSPLGQAPVIQDGDLRLFESAACVEYLIRVHGKDKFILPASHKNFADYVYWFHFSNGTFQPIVSLLLNMSRVDTSGNSTTRQVNRLGAMLKMMDNRLRENTWLAGEEFTAADIMVVFTLTTMRAFYPYDLTGYDGILAYLQRVVKRDGYQRARAKGDPNLETRNDGKAPRTYPEQLKAEGKL